MTFTHIIYKVCSKVEKLVLRKDCKCLWIKSLALYFVFNDETF